MTLNTLRARLIINAKKGWTDEARAKALLKRKRKSEVGSLYKKFVGKSQQSISSPPKNSEAVKSKSLKQIDKELNSPEILKLVKIPPVMYHVTSRLNQDSISKTGLRKSKKTSTEGKQLGSYLTDKAGLMELQRGGGSDLNRTGGLVVFEVKTKGLKLRLDPEFWDGSDPKSYVKAFNSGETTKSMYSQESIPKSKLKLSKMKVL